MNLRQRQRQSRAHKRRDAKEARSLRFIRAFGLVLSLCMQNVHRERERVRARKGLLLPAHLSPPLHGVRAWLPFFACTCARVSAKRFELGKHFTRHRRPPLGTVRRITQRTCVSVVCVCAPPCTRAKFQKQRQTLTFTSGAAAARNVSLPCGFAPF